MMGCIATPVATLYLKQPDLLTFVGLWYSLR